MYFKYEHLATFLLCCVAVYAQCPTGWYNIVNMCMKCMPTSESFVDATDECRKLGAFVSQHSHHFQSNFPASNTRCGFWNVNVWVGFLYSGCSQRLIACLACEKYTSAPSTTHVCNGGCVQGTPPSSGSWSYRYGAVVDCTTRQHFTCTKGLITCPTLPTPVNGITPIYKPTSRYIYSVANYTCQPGYTLIGNATRTCQEDSHWNGTEPRCTTCSELPTPENGTVTYSPTASGKTYQVNTVANYNCTAGFNLFFGSEFRTCLDTGLWNGTRPSCVQCRPLEVPQNSNVTYSTSQLGGGHVVNTQATYTCDRGHYPAAGDVIRSCLPSGFWNGTMLLCKPVDCGKPNDPLLGKVYARQTTYRKKAVYVCDRGNKLSGARYRLCDEYGKWNEAEPSCSPEAAILGFGIAFGGVISVAAPLSIFLLMKLIGNVTQLSRVAPTNGTLQPTQTPAACPNINTPATLFQETPSFLCQRNSHNPVENVQE